MVGTVIGARAASTSTEDQGAFDGTLASAVLHLLTIYEPWAIQVTRALHAQRAGNAHGWTPHSAPRTCERARPQVRGGDAKLDQAFLLFFQQFRKSYVGETAQRSTKVRARP